MMDRRGFIKSMGVAAASVIAFPVLGKSDSDVEFKDLWARSLYFPPVNRELAAFTHLYDKSGKMLVVDLFHIEDYKDAQHNEYLALLSRTPYSSYKYRYRVRAFSHPPSFGDKRELVGYMASDHPWFATKRDIA